jgi:hypothetical protein
MPRPHIDRHPTYVDGCFACKLLTLQYQSKAPSTQSLMEARWERDMPAYARLRRDGLQPKAIDGCGTLEQRAETQAEVEMGHLFTKEQMPIVNDIMAESRESARGLG